MQLDQVNNEDHTWWVGSRVQSRDGADACAHGLLKGTFIIDIDQQLSDPVSQKNLQPSPVDFIRQWDRVGKQGDGWKSSGRERGCEGGARRAAEQDPGLQGPRVGRGLASNKAIGWRPLFNGQRDLKGKAIGWRPLFNGQRDLKGDWWGRQELTHDVEKHYGLLLWAGRTFSRGKPHEHDDPHKGSFNKPLDPGRN